MEGEVQKTIQIEDDLGQVTQKTIDIKDDQGQKDTQETIEIEDIPTTSTCKHGKRLNRCATCTRYSCTIPGCPKETHRFAGAYVLMRHMRNSHSGATRALTKRRELEVHTLLEREGVEFRYQTYLPFRTCGLKTGTTCCYFDFAIDMPWGTLLLEVDEDQHFNYPPECDVQRDLNIAASIALGSQTKTIILRYNPDHFSINNDVQRTPKNSKLKKLLETIKQFEKTNPSPHVRFARFFLDYDSTNGMLDVSHSWPKDVCTISKAVL